MRDDFEETLAHNPVLLARCFWHLSHRFATSSGGSSPPLPVFLICAGMLRHSATVAKISGMNYESGLSKVVSDRPDLAAGLQLRIEEAFDSALVALQVACAAGLLIREPASGFPRFRAMTGTALPARIREAPRRDREIAAAKRLGTWFGRESIESVLGRFALEF